MVWMKTAVLTVVALAAIATGLALAVTDEKPTPGVTATPASKASTTELIGQHITTGYVGVKPPKTVLRAARDGKIGGVILFTNNMPSTGAAKSAIAKLQRWAAAGKQPPLFVMIDQEGGIVQRLPQIPPHRTPAQIGHAKDAGALAKREGTDTGRALHKLGFNVNLAPVVDVTKVNNSFLGNRSYGRSAAKVADAGCGFAAGNENGGVAATFKHFPGLGRAGADTDFADVTINASRSSIEADLKPYTQCPDTPSLVMIASARYPKLDIDVPASLSKKSYAMLAETGFKGLTITDALETPQFGSDKHVARAALKAGVDILLYGQAWAGAMRARSGLVSEFRDGTITRAQLEKTYNRIAELKTQLAD
jgi:beta-N-acetylhexosaminidase